MDLISIWNWILANWLGVGLFVGFWIIFGSIMFWAYGLSPILHWFIKANGEPAKAVILESRDAGWGWYEGSRYTQTLVFQPVKVKLEVHPTHGTPYIAQDKFNAKREYYRFIQPGTEIQVSIANFNPQWIACWPETVGQEKRTALAEEKAKAAAYEEQRRNAVIATERAKLAAYDEQVRQTAFPGVQQAAAPASKKMSTGTLIGAVVIVLVVVDCCMIGVGAFAYSRFAAADSALPGMSGQIATAASGGLSAPGFSSGTTVAPGSSSGSSVSAVATGGLGDETTRATAWGYALTAVLQANPMSCTVPDATHTTIEVTQQPDSSGAWQERWMVACDGASAIPVNMTFTPSSGGMFTVKATVAK